MLLTKSELFPQPPHLFLCLLAQILSIVVVNDALIGVACLECFAAGGVPVAVQNVSGGDPVFAKVVAVNHS